MCQDVCHWEVGIVVSCDWVCQMGCMSWAHAYDSGNFYIQQQTADSQQTESAATCHSS